MMTDDKPAQNSKYATTATGNAKVDQQIGHVEGDAVFHKHETIYQVASDDSAERKYRVARNNLDGGIPRVAENLIGQALDAGLANTEIAYYYAIAVLSDRSPDQLGAAELDKLYRALSIANDFPPDEWRAATGLIGQLMRCVLPADEGDSPEPGALQVVLDGFAAVQPARRDELKRHLDMILTGAVQDQLDRIYARTIATERMSGDRADRAWKYFHPDPVKPRRARPVPLQQGQPRARAWTGVMIGAVVLGGCVALGLGWSLDIGALAPQWGLVLATGLVTGWSGTRVLTVYVRRRMKVHESTRYPELLDEFDLDAPPTPAAQRFADQLWRRIDYYFTRRRPTNDKNKWNTRTLEVKVALHYRLTRLFGTAGTPLPSLNWLIRWHAKRTAEQWRDSKVPDFRRSLHPGPADTAWLAAGTASAIATVIWLGGAAVGLGPVLGVLTMVQIGALWLAGSGVAYLLGDSRAIAAEQAELDELYEAERREFVRWRKRLRDRPTDAEMSRWLDQDKAYLKAMAMRRCGLSNNEIVAHVVLTAKAPRAKSARVRNGPPRYSKYIVLVFLLTDYGVRQVDAVLNFETGAIYDETRRNFRYDALESAEVREIGFHSAAGRTHLLVHNQQVRITDKPAVVMQRVFQLTLVGGGDVEVTVDNYDGLTDQSTPEDKSTLDDMALDSSGVTVALQVLEAVAAEGRDWIRRDRERRRRRWQDWRDTRLGRTAIGWPLSIGPGLSG